MSGLVPLKPLEKRTCPAEALAKADGPFARLSEHTTSRQCRIYKRSTLAVRIVVRQRGCRSIRMFGLNLTMKPNRIFFGGLSAFAALFLTISAFTIFLTSILPWLRDPDFTHSTVVIAGMIFNGPLLFVPFGVFLTLALFSFGLARWLFQIRVGGRTTSFQ